MQSGSAMAICRFTLQTTSTDSTQNTKSNCRSTSARLVPVKRSRGRCSMHGLVIIMTLILTSHSLCFCATDRLKLSRYVLEDLLNCKVDCWIIVCIQTGAQGNPTEASYSDQARSIALYRNDCGIATESWRMVGEIYHILQGTISGSSFCDKVMSDNLSESRPLHYFDTHRGDFGISFNETNQVLSVPWYGVVHYS